MAVLLPPDESLAQTERSSWMFSILGSRAETHLEALDLDAAAPSV